MERQVLVIGTTNPAKARNCRAALAGTRYVLRELSELPTSPPAVAEVAGSAEENALHKALSYATAASLPAVSLDFALFFDGVPETVQPGLHVRRIPYGVVEPSDEELLAYYSDLFERLGGRVPGRWEIGIAAATPGGKSARATIAIHRGFVSTPSAARIPGYPLASLQLVGSRYVAELSPADEEALSASVLREPMVGAVDRVLG